MSTAERIAARVRPATGADAAAVAAMVRELLLELGAAPPEPAAMAQAARALIAAADAGAVLVAEDEGTLVGVLSASWQSAIHIPGRYGIIQDLWVHRSRRRGAIGAALLEALFTLAREAGIARVEVGLPREGFAGLPATERFYRRGGFAPVGPRMRRMLA